MSVALVIEIVTSSSTVLAASVSATLLLIVNFLDVNSLSAVRASNYIVHFEVLGLSELYGSVNRYPVFPETFCSKPSG